MASGVRLERELRLEFHDSKIAYNLGSFLMRLNTTI
jgi:hypothetical protein